MVPCRRCGAAFRSPVFILADCEEEEDGGWGGGQTGNETRPIQLIKASAGSLISSGRRLQGQERTAGRLKAERGEETQPKRAENQMLPIDRPPPLFLWQPFICQMH